MESLTPGKISNSFSELGDVGKPFLIKALFITPSRSKKYCFFHSLTYFFETDSHLVSFNFNFGCETIKCQTTA